MDSEPTEVTLNPAILQRINARRDEYIALLETVITALGLQGSWEFDAEKGILRKVV